MNNTTFKGQYADVNGIHLYYELFGQGSPLVLLHGGIGAMEMFGDVLNQLAASRQVIGVDLQAHCHPARYDALQQFHIAVTGTRRCPIS